MGRIKALQIVVCSLFVCFLFSSCVEYMTIYEMDAPELKMYDNNYFVFESEKLNIHYDFWSEGGIPVIEMINMSPDTLIFDFTKSRFNIMDQSFAFADEKWPEDMEELGSEIKPSAMYGDLPKKVNLAPDSTFSFQGMPTAYIQLEELSRGEEKRYLYTNSPHRITQDFVYSNSIDSTLIDTSQIRLYVNHVNNITSSQFKEYLKGQPLLANRFYLYNYSAFTYDDRSIISGVLTQLFRK